MDYPGKVITKTQVTPTQTSASGNWTLDDQAAAIKNNNWPVALVPNPISKSLRFNSADSAYLNRTPASAGNRTTWTWSGWVKRGGITLSSNTPFFSAGTSSSEFSMFYVSSTTDRLVFYTLSGGVDYGFQTSAVLRDPSAWYHLMCVYDSTNGTAANRLKLYINGVQYTDKATDYGDIPLNHQTFVNATNEHLTGKYTGNTQYLDGYMTEVNFIDGQALTPSDFGLTNPQTGQWIPKKYTGTYGTNGFYLNFKDATSTTTLGYDYSGNANNWTTNNFSVTAGSGNDSLTDVPTPWVAYNTTGDVGGVIRGNYATFNPLLYTGSGGTKTDGNLQFAAGGTGGPPYNYSIYSTFTLNTGKWYWEMAISGASSQPFVGLFNTAVAFVGASLASVAGPVVYGYDGNYYNETSGVSFGSTYTAGDVIGIAVDFDNNLIWFSKNGTFQNSGVPASGTNGKSFGSGKTWGVGYVESGSSVNRATFVANFGQRPFAYTPPAGFRSLCTTNLPATTIGFGLTNQANKYFDVSIWTGNNASRNITNNGSMQPDFVWIKDRSRVSSNDLVDAVRGVNKALISDSTASEYTGSFVSSFNSDGFSLPANGLGDNFYTNISGDAFVGWQWRASNVTAVSNTAGTITSTVSANTTAGFSIVTYTGNGTNGATVGHGLGVAPSMIIIKVRNAADNWPVYHRSLGNTDAVFLNTTAATQALTYWNSTTPSSTVFTLGSNLIVNKSSDTFVAYCFAAVAGYSAFGSYTGNGSSDGPFVYLGFRPRFILTKSSSSAFYWVIEDAARNPSNVVDLELFPNDSLAETNASRPIDFLSNGFKIRHTGNTQNASGGTYIYAAFAESPFQFSNAR